MFLKPLLKDFSSEKENSSLKEKGGIKSRLSLTRESFESLRLALADEIQESIEIDGRLLMLPLLEREQSLAFNKKNHDLYSHGFRLSLLPSWVWCSCDYAKHIRLQDLEIPLERWKALWNII